MKIYAFCCENAVKKELEVKDLKVIKLPCSGRLDTSHILKAFEKDADGVLIFACYDGACKFINGNAKTKKRLSHTKKILKEIGIDEWKVQMWNLQENQEEKLSEIIQNFKNEIAGGKK